MSIKRLAAALLALILAVSFTSAAFAAGDVTPPPASAFAADDSAPPIAVLYGTEAEEQVLPGLFRQYAMPYDSAYDELDIKIDASLVTPVIINDVHIVNTVPVGEFAMPTFNLSAKSAFLIEQSTGSILYEKKADDRVAVASITKIMTILLVLEAVESGKISLSDHVPISEHAFSMGGSQIWLEPGEIFTVDELLKAVVISSANDAAVALAEYVGGSEPVFAEMMTDRAQQLGMHNTVFKNACGLDEEGHFSTARDVALMSQELLKHPKILEYTTIWTDSLRGGETLLTNTNRLLRSYSGVTGLKTGTTDEAGICISVSAYKNGMGIIAVVLGAPSSEARFADARQMLDYSYANYHIVKFPQLVGMPTEVKVKGGDEKLAKIKAEIPEALLFMKGSGIDLQATYNLVEEIESPLKKGSVVGTVTLKDAKGVVKTFNIVSEQDIEKMNLKIAFSKMIESAFSL